MDPQPVTLTNVIEFPGSRTDDAPPFRRQSVAELVASDRPPEHADFIFLVQQDAPEGRVSVTIPGTGFVDNVAVDRVHKTLTLSFPHGLDITVSGDARILWYPAP
jgi:hypothetical protein